jgi:hypothetical protein
METSSLLTNILLRVICDPKGSIDLTATAADLMSTGARINSAITRSKRTLHGKPKAYYDRLTKAHSAAIEALFFAWHERERTDDMRGVADAIREQLTALIAALNS